jgi:hypothetical protein
MSHRDVGVSIAKTAICCSLAEGIYYARSQYHGIAVPDYNTLAPREKQAWIQHAQDTMEAVAPAPGARRDVSQHIFDTMKRVVRHQHNRSVVGRISPEAPWGETA